MTHVVVLDDYQDRASEFAPWSSLGTDVTVAFEREHLMGDALYEAVRGAEVIVVMRERTRIDRQLIERLDDLQLIVTTGGANIAIDSVAASERGIVFCGTRGSGTSVTELAWGLILSITKHIPQEDRLIRSGGWQETIPADLSGKTLGIAGLGRLGSSMVPVAKAFQMKVIAWSENLDSARARSLGAEPVSKADLLEQADVLSIHLRLSDRTQGLFGRSDLARMKPTAFLVNTARGPIVDEDALIDALTTGQIAGAGLDVFDDEPFDLNHPFRKLENVVVTPHLGYVSDASYRIYYSEVVEDIGAFLKGNPIRVVPPEAR
jgi:phosphoglycerate dehydrogenase-like enzyme